MSAERLSIREYGRRSGVSEAYIRKLIKQGIIEKVNGRIDPDQADAAWTARRDRRYRPRRAEPQGQAQESTQQAPAPAEAATAEPLAEPPSGVSKPPAVPEPTREALLTQAEAIALKTQWDALLKQQEYDRNRGELLPRQEVTTLVQQAMVTVATQLDGLGGRLAHELAAETDPAVIRRRLLDECRRIRAAAAAELEGLVRAQPGSDDPAAAPGTQSGSVGG